MGLLSTKGKIIIRPEDFYFELQLRDINKDGFNDVQINIMGNDPYQFDVYFYDPAIKSFRKIENCMTELQKLEETNFYYSYNKGGCAGQNWESHLSKIENWMEDRSGKLYFNNCGDEEDGIFIYKVVPKGEDQLIDSIPISKFRKEGKNDEWTYIKKYWIKNYKLFE